MKTLKILLGVLSVTQLIGFINCESEYNDGFDDLWVENPTLNGIKEAYGKIMKQFMDASVNPCEDLIEYSCGTWRNTTKIESIVEAIQSRKSDYFATVLEYFSTNENLTESNYRFPFEIKRRIFEITDAEEMALTFYRSCKNSVLVKQMAPELILKYIKDFDTGNWPVENYITDDKSFDWTEMLADMRKIGISALFSFSLDKGLNVIFDVDADIDDTYYKKIEDNGLTIVYDQEKITEIVKYLVNNTQEIPRIMDEIIEFDRFLFGIYNRTKELNKEELIKFSKFNARFSELSFSDFIYNLFLETDKVGQVKVRNIEYFSELEKLIEKTPEITIRRYLNFRLVRYLYEMNTELSSKNCAKRTANLMTIPMDALYIRYHLTPQIIEDVTEILKYLEDAFLDFFQTSDWIDDGSKRIFSAKVEDYIIDLGFDFDGNFLDELRSEFVYVELNESEYFENLNALLPKKFDYQFAYKSRRYPSVYNAAYHYARNRIMIHTGILHPPTYHFYAPAWAKFANLAYIIGHEMGHSFDIRGFMYNSTHKRYEHLNLITYLGHFKRSVCFARQYNKYGFEKDDKHLDGIETLRENMSDNLGLTLAYTAYQQWLKDHPDKVASELVEGLELSLDQIFFLSRAQNMCNREMSTSIRDVHSPKKFRLIGKISNSREFAEAFQCAEGSRMNPIKKCIF